MLKKIINFFSSKKVEEIDNEGKRIKEHFEKNYSKLDKVDKQIIVFAESEGDIIEGQESNFPELSKEEFYNKLNRLTNLGFFNKNDNLYEIDNELCYAYVCAIKEDKSKA
jgi:hypothetical protein